MPQFGEPGERIGYEVYPHPKGAPPILLIHGFTASSASFSSNLQALRERFTVVTADLLGHGGSDAPADPHCYTPEHTVERIVGLMDHLGYDRAMLCGHSLGGAVALRVALDYPERVAGLVIINSNSAAGSPRWREQVQPGLDDMARRVRAEGTGFLKESRLYPARSSRLPTDAREALRRDFDALKPEGIAGTAEGLVARVNAFERLPELAVPTLIVVGDRDQEFANNAPRMIANIRRNVVQLVTIEEAGHAANLEQPEPFNHALTSFSEEIGYLPEVGRGSKRKTLLFLVGGSLITAALAFLAAAFIISRRDDNEQGFLPTATSSATRSAGTAGTPRPGASAVLATTPPGSTSTATAAPPSPTQTSGPGTPTPTPPPPTPTNRPPATPTPNNNPQPTPTPTDEPPPTATPTATPPPPTPTPTTPAGRFVTVSAGGSGLTRTFVATLGGPTQLFLRIDWASSAGSPSPASLASSTTVTFPGPGTYTVTATATYSDGARISGSTTVTVP